MLLGVTDAPVVAMTSPSETDTIVRDEALDILVAASDADGVASVESYAGGPHLGTDSEWPDEWTWTPTQLGSVPLMATAGGAGRKAARHVRSGSGGAGRKAARQGRFGDGPRREAGERYFQDRREPCTPTGARDGSDVEGF